METPLTSTSMSDKDEGGEGIADDDSSDSCLSCGSPTVAPGSIDCVVMKGKREGPASFTE